MNVDEDLTGCVTIIVNNKKMIFKNIVGW